MLIVSHDQSFLDNVCTDIIHLDMEKLFYYKGNYSMFKKMHLQKRKEQIKDYEKQEKRLKELKSQGQSKKAAEKKQKEALTKKQEKNRAKLQKNEDDSTGPVELMQRPREYVVKFRFPEPPPLQPPVLGIHNVTFGYDAHRPMSVNLPMPNDPRAPPWNPVLLRPTNTLNSFANVRNGSNPSWQVFAFTFIYK